MELATNLKKIGNITHGFYSALDYEKSKDPILMHQVHSPDALIIYEKPETAPKVDALVTNVKGLNLTVKTADCAPVLIIDNHANVIAAIHAGWKGAFQGIIENTVLKMLSLGSKIDNMVAAIGPHIQKESFEIDETMKALFPITENHFFEKKENNKYLFDFDAYVIARLQRIGIKNINSIQIDTYTNKTYFSYRREPENPGRQYSSIMLKD